MCQEASSAEKGKNYEWETLLQSRKIGIQKIASRGQAPPKTSLNCGKEIFHVVLHPHYRVLFLR